MRVMASLAKMVIIVVALLRGVWELSDGARIQTTKIERFTQCDTLTFAKGSHYDTNRDLLLQDMEASTIKAKGCRYSTESVSSPLVFGHSNCSAVLADCSPRRFELPPLPPSSCVGPSEEVPQQHWRGQPLWATASLSTITFRRITEISGSCYVFGLCHC